MRQILLDTDTCIEIIRGRPTPLEQFVDANIGISSITRFELYSGVAKHGSRKLANRTSAFLSAITCYPFDDSASETSAKIRMQLEAIGQKIGAYDTLIAGHCLALKFELLTGNLREFSRVKELKLIPLR